MAKTKVIFICTHNSARSQIAEALLRYIYGDKYEVFSAGTNPTKINPYAIKVLSELGIDASSQYSKSLDEYSETEIDLAVAVCQNSSKTVCTLCSSPPMDRPPIVNAKLHRTKNYIVHGFEDPSEVEGSEEQKLAVFRRIRDEIKAWITEYFANENLAQKKLA